MNETAPEEASNGGEDSEPDHDGLDEQTSELNEESEAESDGDPADDPSASSPFGSEPAPETKPRKEPPAEDVERPQDASGEEALGGGGEPSDAAQQDSDSEGDEPDTSSALEPDEILGDDESSQPDAVYDVEEEDFPVEEEDEADELESLFLSADEDSEGIIEVVTEDGEDNAEVSAQQLEEVLEERDELREKLAEVEEERDEIKERWVRTAADLDNLRKRSKREKEELRKYGTDKLASELLPAIDNLERALAHVEEGAREDESGIVDGVEMVYRQILTALEKFGIVGFESEGEKFNPEQHEAIQQVESDEHDTGTVVEQFQKGYFIHDRLLRPALVSVAKRVSDSDNESSSQDENDSSEEEGSENEVED